MKLYNNFSHMTDQEPREYPPSISLSLSHDPYTNEKYSPFSLYQYVWSRLAGLTIEEEQRLGSLLQSGEVIYRNKIAEAIDLEQTQDKNAALNLLEQFRGNFLRTSEVGPYEADEQEPDKEGPLK
jgi:hypothetical protein